MDQKQTVTIKFKAGTVCEVQDVGIHSLFIPLVLECDCEVKNGKILVNTANVKECLK